MTTVFLSVSVQIEADDEEHFQEMLDSLIADISERYDAEVDVLSEDEDEPFEEIDEEDDTE